MGYVLRDYQQIEVYTAGDSTVHIRAQLLCDTVSDLPTPTAIPGFTMEAGSVAWIIGEVIAFMLDTGGAWRQQRSADLSSIITDISQIRDDIQIDENRISSLETVAAHLIDGGNKNLLPFVMPSSGVLTLIDNGDGSFTLSGTTASVLSLHLGDVYGHGGEDLHLSGCPAGGDYAGGYSLIITNSSGITQGYDEGNGYDFSRPADESFFRVYCRVRAGTYNSVLFEPMVTYMDFYNLSRKFVSYSPSNAELYRLIRSYHP